MSFIQFIRLLIKNLKFLILVPTVLAISIWYFTRHEKKTFSSETVIYTGIASGYSLNGDNHADYFSTSNAYDNLLSLINSRQTREEVAITLLSTHLFYTKHDPSILGWDAYQQLKSLVPDSVRKVVVKPTLEETQMAVTSYLESSDSNSLYALLNSNNPYYSYSALSGIKPLRINSSDLIKISYETTDAAICKHTLELMVEIFMKKHRALREGQTGSVIAYFEKEVRDSYHRLDSAEQLFLSFNRQNDIINYYEQTKAVAGERENLYSLNHSLEMDRNAEEKAFERINQDLKGRVHQNSFGSDIIKKKEKLADIYSQISLTEIMGKDLTGSQKKYLDSLRNASSVLESDLETSVQSLATLYNTPKGIPVKSVLDEWVKTSKSFEQSKARLTIMDKRKREFEEEYKKLAPLGAILKRIERQISVAEQEYLELLHGLNQARLSQQNNQLTSKLTIVDPPFLPLQANPSKRVMLIVGGFMGGFVLVLAILLAQFLLNKKLQFTVKAVKKIGAPLLGIYPHFKERAAFLSKANLRIMQHLVSKLTLNGKPVIIGVVSTQENEGKSAMIDIWQKEFTKMKLSVQKQVWVEGEPFKVDGKSQIVLLEFPALDSTIINTQKIPKLDHTILVSKTDRTWGRIDQDLLNIFAKATATSPMLVLNGVSTDDAEEYIGKVPKKPGLIKSLFERLASLQYREQLNFQ